MWELHLPPAQLLLVYVVGKLELKYRGSDLGSLLEEFVFKRASLSSCTAFTAQQ